MKQPIGILLTLTLLLAACNSVDIPVQDDLIDEAVFIASLKTAAIGSKTSKLSADLRILSNENMELQNTSVLNKKFVTLDIISDNPEVLLAQLTARGLKNGSFYEGIVSGRMPISQLSSLENAPNLRFARQALAFHEPNIERQISPIQSQGVVISQGDKAQASDVARSKYSVAGRGVKIGVLSDSYDKLSNSSLTTAAEDIASGDLPAEGVQIIEEFPELGSDEGRAMLQIVHDIAPASPLAFATAFTGEAGFANNILKLANVGSKVIVDDVIYFAEPMFQDGIIAQAVDKVTNQGVTYFSSAGNGAKQSFESPFRKANRSIPNIGALHDFDPGQRTDHSMRYTIPVGGIIALMMQWDEPFASASRGGRGSSSDVDFYLLDRMGKLLPTNSNLNQLPISDSNNLHADPFEYIIYANTTNAPFDVNLIVVLAQGNAPTRMKWVDFGDAIPQEYDTRSATTYGHANSRGAAAVGASRYDQTPAFGQNPPLLQSFSSRGGTPILRDRNGNRMSETRLKPLFVAPNCADTTFFGFDLDGTGKPNFCGTSASAPHAAGVAALMLEKYKLSPAIVQSLLAASAIDMNKTGFDNDTGFGLIQADKALSFLNPRY